MIVACLNAGNYAGRGQRYVEGLHRMVRRHLTVPHRFVCFTDDEAAYAEGIELRGLPHGGLKGWMNKLSLFKPDVFCPSERVVYFDLDSFIVGNIDFLADYQERFAMLGPFFVNVAPIFAGLQSGVMAWRGGFGATEIWAPFAAAGFPNTVGGDQRFINDLHLGPERLQQLFPGKFASYKGHCMDGVPAGVAVVAFHGLPRPHQAGGWARQVWRDSAAQFE